MSRASIATFAIAAAFAILGLCRVNGLSLLEPDTPEYFFGAKALAHLDGYREIDKPGAPLHTFRPPGLSLLLAPLAWVAPYGVVPAKVLLVALAAASLLLVGRIASSGGLPWSGPLAAALVASSPYTLLHATEVVTEIPYLAVALGVLVLVAREDAPDRRRLALVTALLAFLPFLRTIGLALIAGVLATALTARAKRGWWPAPVLALVPTIGWMARNHAAGGATYFGAIAVDFAKLGPSAFAAKAAAAFGFYAGRLVAVLLPGAFPGRPLYERMIVGGAPELHGVSALGAVVGIAILVLAARGAYLRRDEIGRLIAWYALAFFAILAVYPPRHERLTWPLIPIVWALVPSGIGGATAARLLRFRVVAIAAAAILIAWQATPSIAMVRDNLALRSGERFYSERVPPIYFADWPAAGRWIAQHAPPDARVLTRHSDLGFTSGRLQESLRFEELPPTAWRSRIAAVGARYLAVPASLYGKFVPPALAGADPAYAYTEVHRERDVAIYAIAPNRAGHVTPAVPPGAEALSSCDAALAREPRRVDLAVRCAELLGDAGKGAEAITRLQAIVSRGDADVRITIALAQALLDAGRPGEALAAFERARSLPEAELLAQTIARGIASATDAASGGTRSAADLVALARARAEALRWREALAAAEEAVRLAPRDPAAVRMLATIDVLVGREDDAERLYAGAGDPALAALHAARAAEADPAGAGAGAVANAAVYWAGSGAPGRALALLDRAAPLFPSDATIAQRRAEVRAYYRLPPG